MQPHLGDTGETYAFDDTGLMISNSRFDDELRELGRITNDGRALGSLILTVPEPLDGASKNSFTKAVHSALSGANDNDMEGFPDYRGQPVIGAWIWNHELNLGITSEIDYSDAFSIHTYISEALYLLIAMTSGPGLYSLGFCLVHRKPCQPGIEPIKSGLGRNRRKAHSST